MAISKKYEQLRDELSTRHPESSTDDFEIDEEEESESEDESV